MLRVAFLALALVAATATANVVDLDPSNFDEVVNGDRNVFVEFYAPWCGHCKNLAPAYEEVGAAYSHVSDVVIAKVDADKDRELGSRFGVTGFPTLKFFPKGSTDPEDYSSGRTAEDIVSFINSKTGANGRIKRAPSDVLSLEPDTFDKYVLDPAKNVLVEFFAPWCGHCKSLAPTYEKLGTTYKNQDDVLIAKVDADKHKSLASRFGVTGFPTLKWFSKDNKEGEDYNSGRDASDFIKFINEKTGAKRILGGGLSEDAGLIDELTDLAKKFKDEASRSETLEKAREAASNVKDEAATWAKYYVKVMEKVMEKGNDYVATELDRLQRVVEGGNVKSDRLDSFNIRRNILKVF